MRLKSPRLAVRAVIIENARLLLVNAWPNGQSDLMCAPGGGVHPHSSLPENLIREVYEETGLRITVGQVCLVNEFHDPQSAFHQVEVFFRANVVSGTIDPHWRDPEAVVSERRWVSQKDMANLHIKPDSLANVAFGDDITYDPLEPIQT